MTRSHVLAKPLDDGLERLALLVNLLHHALENFDRWGGNTNSTVHTTHLSARFQNVSKTVVDLS
jgi:hypothetical protein